MLDLFRDRKIGDKGADENGGRGDGGEEAIVNRAGPVIQPHDLYLVQEEFSDRIQGHALEAGKDDPPALVYEEADRRRVIDYPFEFDHGAVYFTVSVFPARRSNASVYCLRYSRCS